MLLTITNGCQSHYFQQKPAVNNPLARLIGILLLVIGDQPQKIPMGASLVSILSASKTVIPNMKPVIACFIIRSAGLHSLTVDPTLNFTLQQWYLCGLMGETSCKNTTFNYYYHLAGVQANSDSLTHPLWFCLDKRPLWHHAQSYNWEQRAQPWTKKKNQKGFSEWNIAGWQKWIGSQKENS